MTKLGVWLSWSAALLALACSSSGGDAANDASSASGGGCPFAEDYGQRCGVNLACDPYSEIRARCYIAHAADPCAPADGERPRIDDCSKTPVTSGGSGGTVTVGAGPGGQPTTGSGTQPGGSTCTAYADHECDLCDDGDCTDSQWNYAKAECEAYYGQCPGYFECVLGSSSCDDITECPHC
jgi:hypothetical protein